MLVDLRVPEEVAQFLALVRSFGPAVRTDSLIAHYSDGVRSEGNLRRQLTGLLIQFGYTNRCVRWGGEPLWAWSQDWPAWYAAGKPTGGSNEKV